MPGQQYNFDQLAREMVVSQLKDAADAPAQAARIARATIVAGVKGTNAAGSKQSPEKSVRMISKGMIAGMLIINKKVDVAAVELLQQIGQAATDTNQDPQEMLTWAMQGIADNAPMMAKPQVDAICTAIDAAFMGAGQVFAELCRKPG
ncbi:MAG: hypothetical protein V3S11_05850, partial [Elusimicrobiota bacterium]